jgi:flagellar biosynthesis anti-sigma factor FlgM
MSNIISPLPQTPVPVESPGAGGTPGANRASTPAAGGSGSAASSADSVTISPAAQTTTQLLTAAREASGVDQAQVDQIRGALAAGTYNIAPEDLAQAIATVLKELA